MLTFNTTSLSLARAIRARTLLEREPLRQLGKAKRWIMVSPKIASLLDGDRSQGPFPDVATERLIATFVAGWVVTVSQKKNNKKPDLERLEGHDEIWALCPRKPVPGWRLLGRFIEKDVLVLLCPWDKHKLAGNYPKAAQEALDDWQQLFGSEGPHRGRSIADYLSPVFIDVD